MMISSGLITQVLYHQGESGNDGYWYQHSNGSHVNSIQPSSKEVIKKCDRKFSSSSTIQRENVTSPDLLIGFIFI